MTKARTLANFISDGSTLADGAISVSEVSGAAPLASPSFTGNLTVDTDTLFVDASANEVGINQSNPLASLHVNDGVTMTGGWIRTQYLEAVFPTIVFKSTYNANSWGGIGYDSTNENLDFWVGSTSEDVSTDAAQKVLRLRDTDGFIWNDSGQSQLDFRVESDSNTHALFVDAGSNRVGVRESSPSAALHVKSSDGGNYASIIEHSAATNPNGLKIEYSGSGDTNTFAFLLKNTARDILDVRGTGSFYHNAYDGGAVVFNEGGNNADFRVESDSNANMLVVDASANKIGIGGSSFNYGSALTVHANDDGGAPTSLFLRNSGTAGGSGAAIQFGYTSGYGAQIRFSGNPSSYRMASTTFATVTGDGTTQDNVQISTSGDTIVYNDLGVGHGGNPDWCLDVQKSVSGNWVAHIENSHSSNGYGLKVRAGDNGDVTSFRVSNYANTNTLLNVYGDGVVSMPLQPAFQVRKNSAQENLPNNDSIVTVSWQTELFDQGGDFASSAFTAPVGGKYFLQASAYLGNVDTAAAYVLIGIRTSNRDYYTLIDPNFSSDLNYFSLNVSVVADMDAGDTAYVYYQQSGGSAQTDIVLSNGTFFSGFLVA